MVMIAISPYDMAHNQESIRTLFSNSISKERKKLLDNNYHVGSEYAYTELSITSMNKEIAVIFLIKKKSDSEIYREQFDYFINQS